MIILTDINKCNALLENQSGRDISVQMYHESLGRLALRIVLPSGDLMYVVGAGCRHYTGPFRWKIADLHIIQEESDGAETYRVIDADAGFELSVDAGIVVAIGRYDEFGDSFDHFLRDDQDKSSGMFDH
jgi:hypothetical protein